MAEDVRNELISGSFKSLEDKNRDTDDEDRLLRNVESKMKRDATDIVSLWMQLKGNASRLR